MDAEGYDAYGSEVAGNEEIYAIKRKSACSVNGVCRWMDKKHVINNDFWCLKRRARKGGNEGNIRHGPNMKLFNVFI